MDDANYVLYISGNGTYYDFPALEKIAQNIEVVETGLHVKTRLTSSSQILPQDKG